MQRSIDDIQVALAQDDILVYHHTLHCHHIVVVHFAADNLNQVFVAFPFHALHLHLVHLINNTLVVRLQYLRTVLPIGFITIVLSRVMTSGNIHSALAFEATNSKTYLRCRTKTLEEIHLNTIRREYIGNGLGKQTTIVATVMSHHYRYSSVLNIFETVLNLNLEQIIGVALCSLRHDVLIHTIGTCAHNSAQSARTKLQRTVETINEFRFIFGIHHCLHLRLCLGIIVAVEPRLGYGHHTCQFFIHITSFLGFYYVQKYNLFLILPNKINRIAHIPHRDCDHIHRNPNHSLE